MIDSAQIALNWGQSAEIFTGEAGGFRLVVWRLKPPSLARTIAPAETRRVTEKGEETVARPRWQTGWIFKRGTRNPMWVGRFRQDALAEDGSRIRRERSVILGPVRELAKRQAQRVLSERLAEINQGRHKPELMIQFERFVLERWEPNIFPTLRYSTVKNYRYLIRRHFLPFFGQMHLPEIGPLDVQMFLSEKAKRFASKTVLSLRNLLSKIFGTAQRWEFLQANSASGAQVPGQADTRERLTLTPEQVRALLGELKEPYRTMILLAVLSGLRRGEIFGLRWRYVDLADGFIVVAESNYEGRQAPPKTRASRRRVYVDNAVLEALARLRPAHSQPDDFVFHTERGTPLNPHNISRRVLRPACQRAGIPVVGWHNFRYTYSTWADPSRESIKALQNQLGHTDSRLTLSVYTQPIPDAQRELASKIARVLLSNAPRLERGEDRSKVLIQ
jgi:integrase